jgi:hypothetical protein
MLDLRGVRSDRVVDHRPNAVTAAAVMSKMDKVKSMKTIHSRSNKAIGDVIEEEWKIRG